MNAVSVDVALKCFGERVEEAALWSSPIINLYLGLAVIQKMQCDAMNGG